MGSDSSKEGGNNKPAPKTQSKPDTEQQKKIKMEGVVRNLDAQIKNFQDKQKKFEVKIDGLKKQAKELLQNDKKTQAKKYIQAATKLKKQSQAFSLRRKAIQGKKFQLQQASMDMQTVNALNGAQQHLKDTQKYNQKLQQIILDTQEQKAVQNQMNDKLKGLVQDQEDMEDVDDMLAELQKEVNKQKKGKIQQKSVNTNVKANTQKNTNKKEEQDQIAKMMAEL